MIEAPQVEDRAGPQWETITEEVLCPLCEYNLRGLTEPRCPECGCRFEWVQLFNWRQYVHPFLFEHHPDENAESFLKTMFAGFRPFRFWSSVRPAHQIHIWRLIIYWFLCFAVLGIAETAVYFSVSYLTATVPTPVVIFSLTSSALTSNLDYSSLYDLCRDYIGVRVMLCVTVLAVVWPWLTFASLMIFQTTMKRARIRARHVLRCVIYAGSAVLPIALFALLIGAGAHWLRQGALRDITRFHDYTSLVQDISYAMAAAGGLIAIWVPMSLIAAYPKYLHFRHAIATILASQVMVILAILVLGFQVLDWDWFNMMMGG